MGVIIQHFIVLYVCLLDLSLLVGLKFNNSVFYSVVLKNETIHGLINSMYSTKIYIKKYFLHKLFCSLSKIVLLTLQNFLLQQKQIASAAMVDFM